MPRTLLPPNPEEPLPAAPTRKRWTPDECAFLERNGLITERYELISGEIVFKMPQNVPHMIAILLISALLKRLFGEFHVLGQGTLTITDTNGDIHKPEPDVTVLRESLVDYTGLTLSPEETVLVVEVSDTMLAFDLRNKAMLHSDAGIAEYWVLDIGNRRLIVHRQPGATGYGEVVEYAEGETVSLLSRPDADIAVADLLPPLGA